MLGTTKKNYRYYIWQERIEQDDRLMEEVYKRKPHMRRVVDNREAYIKKRMALEGLK
jgi:hypothetical protein